jgi:hypothetical protein
MRVGGRGPALPDVPVAGCLPWSGCRSAQASCSSLTCLRVALQSRALLGDQRERLRAARRVVSCSGCLLDKRSDCRRSTCFIPADGRSRERLAAGCLCLDERSRSSRSQKYGCVNDLSKGAGTPSTCITLVGNGLNERMWSRTSFSFLIVRTTYLVMTARWIISSVPACRWFYANLTRVSVNPVLATPRVLHSGVCGPVVDEPPTDAMSLGGLVALQR